VVYLTPELKALIAAQIARVDTLQRKLERIIPWLFPHLRGALKPNAGRRRVPTIGERRRDFRKTCPDGGTAAVVPHYGHSGPPRSCPPFCK
jgi:hypothetical protein